MFSFSTTAYEVSWESLQLPAMPVRLAVDQHGRTAPARQRVRAAALAELRQLGLGQPPDLDHRLVAMLTLLARHDRAVDLRELAGRERSAVAVTSGGRGVLAAIEGQQIAIRAVSGDHIVAELLGLLPPAPPGRGRACSVRSDVLQHAMAALSTGTDNHQARVILREAGIRGGDVEHLLHTARSGVGASSIGVHRTARGRLRLVGTVAYTDTPGGRYITIRRDDPAGRSYTSLVPVDATGLRRHIQDLLTAGVS